MLRCLLCVADRFRAPSDADAGWLVALHTQVRQLFETVDKEYSTKKKVYDALVQTVQG